MIYKIVGYFLENFWTIPRRPSNLYAKFTPELRATDEVEMFQVQSRLQ